MNIHIYTYINCLPAARRFAAETEILTLPPILVEVAACASQCCAYVTRQAFIYLSFQIAYTLLDGLKDTCI